MPRNILQDIKPLTRTSRSIEEREFAITNRPIKRRAEEEYIAEDEHVISPEETAEYGNTGSGGSRSRFWIWLFAGVSIIVLVFAILSVFQSATVNITQKTKDFSFNASYKAVKDGREGELSFEITALSGEESKSVIGTEKTEAASKAVGMVVIYNEFSATAQPLLIETRLEAKDGKIFKTDKAVVVPGYTKKGTEITPGSVKVGVHADVAGEDYNIGLSDLKIFGFKGSPKYDKFYARSVSPMTGGSEGVMYTLAEAEKNQATTDLKKALYDKLLAEVTSEFPPGFMYFDNGVFFTADESGATFSGKTENINAIMKGKISVIVFNEAKLSQYLAKSTMSQYDGSPVTIEGLKDLKFTIKNKETVAPTDAKEILFTLDGDAKFVWDVDVSKLKSDLAGKSKEESSFKQILSSYTGIDTAELTIRPFWKRTFPKNEQNIHVIVNPQ
jgi:hypothetical protein